MGVHKKVLYFFGCLNVFITKYREMCIYII